MEVFEVIIALLLGGALLSALARKLGAPYPALVAFAGAALALIPGVPSIALDPELAIALFIAPVLLDAAYDASPRDLRKNWREVTSLALGAVVLTVAAVAMVARYLIPGLPWAGAIALGAIVAPPDAAAATTVLKQLRPPHRLLVILEGESLFNDASALLIYRIAVAAAITGTVSNFEVMKAMILVTLGSLALGWVLAKVIIFSTSRIEDVATGVLLQFCSTFAVWIIAERLHLSGIITTVVVAMIAARRVPEILPARMRIPAFAFWDVAVFVLNVLAFVLVGLQLKSIVGRVDQSTGLQYVLISTIICATVVFTRLAWVMGRALVHRKIFDSQKKDQAASIKFTGLNNREALAVGWCGMRGTVTLATALALPLDFLYRDVILATAFGVTLGTLVIQGLTLKPLIKKLGLKDDGSIDRETALARIENVNEALKAISDKPLTKTGELVKRSFLLQLENQDPEDAEVLRIALKAQRKHIVDLRQKEAIGDTAFQILEEELDWMELGWEQVLGKDKL